MGLKRREQRGGSNREVDFFGEANNGHLHDLFFPSWNVSARKLLDFGSSADRLFYQKGIGNLWILLWIREHS